MTAPHKTVFLLDVDNTLLDNDRTVADLFRPVHDATGSVDGWVSLEVSPLLADAAAGSVQASAQLRARPQRPNLFIKIPRTAAGIYLDYSKNRISDETIRLLLGLADECGLRERINAMFCGERINLTEKRAVLHIALRAPATERIVVDGSDVVSEVHAVL